MTLAAGTPCAACAAAAGNWRAAPLHTAASVGQHAAAPASAPPASIASADWPPFVDTIYQLSSGLGGASASSESAASRGLRAPSAVGVALIRISGPLALPLLLTLTRRSTPPKARMATRVNLYHVIESELLTHFDTIRCGTDAASDATSSSSAAASSARMIDTGILALYFPSPHSFTGEDVVELHIHGTPLLVANTFEAIEEINRRLVRQIVAPGTEGTGSDDAEATDSASLSRQSNLLSYPPLLRLAHPGEFTRRAFHGGKLDLVQVEALGDLLAAQTDRQRDQALVQMRGELSEIYAAWRSDLLNSLAYIEAILDFSEDEQDVAEAEVVANVVPKVNALAASLRNHLEDHRRGELTRSGIQITIAGAPNAGKSTLLNALSQRSVAIVSPVPGTTRDIVENAINIRGWACLFSDTAGLRALGQKPQNDAANDAESAAATLTGHDLIEAEGMKRTLARVGESDIKLVLLDSTQAVSAAHPFDPQVLNMIDEAAVVVFTKTDLLPRAPPTAVAAAPKATPASSAHSASTTGRAKLKAAQQFYARTTDAFSPEQVAHFHTLLRESDAYKIALQRGASIVFLACDGSSGGSKAETNKGVQELLSTLERQIQRTVGLDGTASSSASSSSSSSSPPSVPLITRARHRGHVSACAGFLDLFGSYMDRGDLVLAAEQLRLATREIGKITGRVDVEELLDVIFEDFCIGK